MDRTSTAGTQKYFGRALDALKSPAALGIYLTFIFVFLGSRYYSIKNQIENDRQPNLLFEVIERMELAFSDFRFRVRGPVLPEARVALLAVDDPSIEEIGEWPWPRSLHAKILSELASNGAAAVGMDMVFSEEQKEFQGRPDEVLGAVVDKYKEKIILGSFSEDSSENHLSYQDYCRNFAFIRANAEKFVTINASFIVNDEADYFSDLGFKNFFDKHFMALEYLNQKHFLENYYKKSDVSQLSERNGRQLKSMLTEANMQFCDQWLTPQDGTVQAKLEDYKQLFSKSEALKNLPVLQAIEKFKQMNKTNPIVARRKWTINNDYIQKQSQYTAAFNAEQDADGTIRNASMFFRTGNLAGTSFVPSLSLQTYLLATGYQARIDIGIDPKNTEQKKILKFQIIDTSQDPEKLVSDIPVDSQGRIKINYFGGKNTFPYLSAKELLNDRDTVEVTQISFDPKTSRWEGVRERVKKADFIKDRAFIYGNTAVGVYDLRVTPFEKNFPGPETHVNTLANLFQRNFVSSPPQEPQWMLWFLLILGILFSIFVAESGAIVGFAVTISFFAALTVADSFLFKKGYSLATVLPFLMIGSLYVIQTFYKYFTEERKKRYLKSTFSKYVSPAIVDEILKDPENVQLGGKKLRMSVMFSDVRGFTTVSEKLDPQSLSDVLNRYLTPMTGIVFSNKGTLDKYMGDAIMSFFGAPIFFEDHAKHACRCALQSLDKLKEIQTQFAKDGLPFIDIGIGINSGDMSVGNMGSDIVRSYTVMGDSVNLASRLEGINKEYGTRIVISEFTYNDIKDSFTAREIDWVKVKGKKEPVRIFELLNEGTANAEWAQTLKFFGLGFELYHQKQFAEALAQFNKSLEQRPGDPVSKLYIERCQEFITEPPPADWDGVFTMKTK